MGSGLRYQLDYIHSLHHSHKGQNERDQANGAENGCCNKKPNARFLVYSDSETSPDDANEVHGKKIEPSSMSTKAMFNANVNCKGKRKSIVCDDGNSQLRVT